MCGVILSYELYLLHFMKFQTDNSIEVNEYINRKESWSFMMILFTLAFTTLLPGYVIRALSSYDDSVNGAHYPSYHELSISSLERYAKYIANKGDGPKNTLFRCSTEICRSKSWISNHLGIRSLQRRFEDCVQTKSIIIAVLGSSVSCGAGSDIGGYVKGLEIYLNDILSSENIIVEVRNIAVGGHGPKFSFICNELQGDEDLIIWEQVTLHENQYTEAFFRGIQENKSKLIPAIIAVFWQPPLQNFHWWGNEELYRELITITERYSIPLLDLRRAMVGQNATCIPDGDKFLYADIIHPNDNGHLLITCLLGPFLGDLLHVEIISNKSKKSIIPNKQRHTRNLTHVSESSPYKSAHASVDPIYKSVLQFNNPRCYSMLKQASDRIRVTDFRGFSIVARPQHGSDNKFKRCWQGNTIGDYLDVVVEPSNIVMLIYYREKSEDMGMVSVTVDGRYIRDVDGWFEGVPWANGRPEYLVSSESHASKLECFLMHTPFLLLNIPFMNSVAIKSRS